MSARDVSARRELSERETEVAELYARGDTYKAIARNLDISPATVRKHLNAIYQKLRVSNKIELLQRVVGGERASTEPRHPIATPTTAPSWAERRPLAVVALEVEPAAGSEPERTHDALQALQRAVEDINDRFGGTIAVRLDGLIVTYFGWPEAHDDDAERAVRAAKEMLEAAAARSAEHLDARAAAAFGTVITDPASGTEVSGEALRSARRMAASGETGRLLIDAGTAELVSHVFHLAPAEPASVGNAARFWVGSAIDCATRFDARASGAISPFVGRQAELMLLSDRWRQAEAGEGQAVLIRGEPGIGKSRLVREFIDTNDLSNAADVIQSLPFHSSTPLHPFVAHLESLTRSEFGNRWPSDRS